MLRFSKNKTLHPSPPFKLCLFPLSFGINFGALKLKKVLPALPQFKTDTTGQNDSSEYLRMDFCNPLLAEQGDHTKDLNLFF